MSGPFAPEYGGIGTFDFGWGAGTATFGSAENYWEATSGPSKMIDCSSREGPAHAQELPYTPMAVHMQDRDQDASYGGKRTPGEASHTAHGHGVARPFLNIEEGPETRPFGD